MGKRELFALLGLSSWCLVTVVWFFLAVPWVCLQFNCDCVTSWSYSLFLRERSGSVVECLSRDRGAAGSSLTGVTALWSLSKVHLS